MNHRVGWVVLGAVVSVGLATALGYAQTEPAAQGDLRVLVFVDDVPADGVLVEIDGAEPRRTGRDGTVVFTLPEGAHTARLAVPRHILPAAQPGNDPVAASTGAIEVVGDEEVEVIVTLRADGRVLEVDVETAEARARVGARRSHEEFARKRASLPQGVVRGKVFERETEAPVVGARVFVRGAPVEAETDEDGAFQLALPEGRYDLTIIHQHYITINLKDVDVDANRPKELRVAADKASAQLDDLVVTAPHIEGGTAGLVMERRESASVDEVIGAEEMSRSGDGDAAGALRRVTGITVVGGQYVYVRGMGERYSATLLNGQAIPSPEPERRVIPLDLFSTDVLESVVIQKTPSPDSPGEFGGGVVLLRTRGFPDEFTLSVSASVGVLTTATFRARPSYQGGSTDFLGFDDGTRELPGEIREGSPLKEGNRFQPGFTLEELAELGRLLPNNYNVTDETVPPNAGLGLTIGMPFTIRGVRGGFLLSSSWDSDYGYSDAVNRRFVKSDVSEGGLALNNDFRVGDAGRTVSLGNIFVAGVVPAKGHEIKATTLLLRITDDEAGVLTGRSSDLGVDIRQYRLQFVERQLFTQQLIGTHTIAALGGAELEWRYAYSRASRYEPDRREYFYADASEDPDAPPYDFQISARPAGNQRIWSDLTDRIHDVGVDWMQPIGRWKLKTGGTLVTRKREFDALKLTFRAVSVLPPEYRRLDPESIWAEEHLNAEDGWVLEDTTQPTDAYTADQDLQAGYLMAIVPITKTIELMTGARVERSRQHVATFSRFNADLVPTEAELDDTDVLPSVTGKWQATEEVIVRAGYGRTVTRPDFRELSNSEYRDVLTAIRYKGNPLLVRGTIDHVDVRGEYYFSTDEVASVAAFYKSFTNPVEQVEEPAVDHTVSWDNAAGATNVGVELELRRRFGLLGGRFDDAFGALNLAFIRSQVDLGDSAGVSTSLERPLQGQSPYVVNLQLGYDDAAGSGITAVVLYNVFGPRIRQVGRNGVPDIYEEPFHQLDFVYRHKLGGGWRVSFKAGNLLDQEVVFTQGIKQPKRYRNGRSFGFSLSWNYD